MRGRPYGVCNKFEVVEVIDIKRILSFAMIICIMLSLVACGNKEEPTQTDKPYTGAPMIVIDGNKYFQDSNVGIAELPECYELGGTLTKEQVEYAISVKEDSKYYFDKQRENLYDFYVYQECKVENKDEFQFAYVLYTLGE